MNKIYLVIISICMFSILVIYYTTDVDYSPFNKGFTSEKHMYQKAYDKQTNQKIYNQQIIAKVKKQIEAEKQTKQIPLKISVEEASLNLLNAIIKNDYDKAEEALKNKANPNQWIAEKEIPLLYFAIYKKVNNKIIELLIKNGANIKDKIKEIPFLSSIIYLKPSNDVLSILVKNGADINVKDLNNYSPLLHAMLLKDTKDAFRISKKLIELGADPNNEYTQEDKSKINLLYYAIIKKLDFAIINLLINNGANLNLIPKQNPLITELIDKDTSDEILNLLITKGVDINKKLSSNHLTPLAMAISFNNSAQSFKISKKLIELGADTNCEISAYNKTTGKHGSVSLLYYAIVKNVNIDIIKLLIQNKADINVNVYDIPLIDLIISQGVSNEILEAVIKAGINISEHTYNSLTPLAMALFRSAKEESYRLSKKLIELGANTNQKLYLLNKLTNKKDAVSLLYLAIYQNSDISLIKLLLDNGADVNFKFNGKSIFEYAKSRKMSKQILDLLVNAGAKTKGLHF